MPLYEYQCDACGHKFEVIQKFSDPLIDTCPKCGSPVHKLFSSPAIQFKGSGFYITDYPKNASGGAPKSSGGAKDKEASASAESPAEKGADKAADKGSDKSGDKGSDKGKSSDKGTESKSDKSTAGESKPAPAPAAAKKD
jgi:putative FmdB family regulatory protein